MADDGSSRKSKIIDKLSDVSFQAEVEFVYTFLRWNIFPSGATESFENSLEQRSQSFIIEEFLPSDNDALTNPWRMFYTGARESTGEEQIEDPLEVNRAADQLLTSERTCTTKRLVISHPQLQQNILNRIHLENEEDHLSWAEMLEKLTPVYYWRDLGSSVKEFVQSCEKCRQQSSSPIPVRTASLSDDTFQDDELEEEMDSDNEEDPSESLPVHREVPYAEEIDHLYTYLTTKNYPPNSSASYKRSIRRRSHQYALGVDDEGGKENGKRVIYLLHPEKSSKTNGQANVSKRLVITEEDEQQRIIQMGHVAPSGKHYGRDKTRDVLTKEYFWRGIHQAISSYIKNCRECQQKSYNLPPSSKKANKVSDSPETQVVDCTEKMEEKTITDSQRGASIRNRTRNAIHEKDTGHLITIKGLRENFAQTTMETFNYLKYHMYPPGSSINAKRTIRKRAFNFSIGLTDTQDWMEVCGLTQPEERLFFIRRTRHDDTDGEEDGDDDGPARRLVLTTEKQRNAAVMKAHINKKGKHLPREQTFKRLAKSYFWVNMRFCVRMYVQDCPCPSRKITPQEVSSSPSSSKTHTGKMSIEMAFTVPRNVGTAQKDYDPLPNEFANLPRGLSSWSLVTPQEVSLILYVYLKWQHYPAECTANFKRMVRKKAGSFCYKEKVFDGRATKWYLLSKAKTNETENHETLEESSDTEAAELQDDGNLASSEYSPIPKSALKPPKCSDPLPQELLDLPKGLSSFSTIPQEQAALALYVYMKWQKYPAHCTVSFKRAIRRKVGSFSYEEQIKDGITHWYLYYKGKTPQTVKKLPVAGDADLFKLQENNMNIDSALQEDNGVQALELPEDGTMDPPEMQENDEMGIQRNESNETEIAMEIGELIGTTENTVTLPPQRVEATEMHRTASAVTLLERMDHHRTAKRLYVCRKGDQERVLQYVHRNIRPNGLHAGRDKMLSVLNNHFYWHDIGDDVRMFLKKCPTCQANRNEGKIESAIHHHADEVEEDCSHHELPSFIQTYLENAVRRDADLESKDRALNYVKASSADSGAPVLEGILSGSVFGKQGGAAVQPTGPDGDSSFFYSCNFCPMKYRLKSSLDMHKRKEHRNPYVHCHVCGKLLKGSRSLRDHMRSHSKDTPFECDFCGKRFRYRSALSVHRRNHLGLKPFTCKECPQRFISKSRRNSHFKLFHEGKGTYLCEVCAKSFSTPLQLKNHLLRVHDPTRQRFVCEICCKQLSSLRTLRVHMLIHTGVRNYCCEKCGKGFKTLDDLNKHMVHHMDVKPCQCHLCDKSFCLKTDLEDHIRAHQGVPMYPCQVCNKQFKNRRSLDRCMLRHNRQNLGVQEFQ